MSRHNDSPSPYRDVPAAPDATLNAIVYPQVEVDLSLIDAVPNTHVLIGLVVQAMRHAGLPKEAQAFKRSCFAAGSYKAVWSLTRKTVTLLHDQRLPETLL